MNRKEFVQTAGLATAALALGPLGQLQASPKEAKVKLGIIGVGQRGRGHLGNLLKRADVDIVAICDIDTRNINLAKEAIAKTSATMPEVFLGDVQIWKKMVAMKQLDGVIIATPWEWHKPMIIGALEAGIKYVGSEVIIGVTLEDHWDVVHAAEKYEANIMMLENVCYRRDVMAVLNMVRLGLFGEIVHLQGGYQHDLRDVKFNDGQHVHGHGVEFGEKGLSEARWRTAHSIYRNGDLYPTHGVGPIANMVNINRGNRFSSLCSFSTKSKGLHSYIVKMAGENHPNAALNFKLGDIVTTSINCVNGETLLLQHDTNLPRPYSLGFRVQGTEGIWMELNNGLYLDGKSSKVHAWDEATQWLEKYDHPLWKRWVKESQDAGHGGMDFFVLHAFVESIKRKTNTPMDVYDAATWSAISPLSEKSIELGNQTVDFPDFTSGKWMTRKPIFATGDEF